MSIVPATETPAPAGSRQLGVRVKPIIRLGMGRQVEGTRRDGTKYTRPEKTDHFTVRGDQRAVAKFRETYGETPKAIRIMLNATVESSLSIQYRAFKGGQADEGGGALVAVGHTNFASADYCGGPDTLTVWNQDGTVTQVDTLGLDAITREPLDEIAKDLGLELYTTLRAGMPDVLGFGSFFELSTKGKESTDNLWSKLREIYSIFGSRAQIAIAPTLVIRPSTARPVVVKDGQAKRIKTQIFVADIVITESIEESFERLRARNELLAPQGATAALYGTAPVAIEAGPQIPADVEPEPDYETDDIPLAGHEDEELEVVEGEVVDDTDTPDGTPADGGSETASAPAAGQQAEGGVVSAQADATPAPDPDDEPDPAGNGNGDPGRFVVPSGKCQGRTLTEVAGMPDGPGWLSWVSDNPDRVRPEVANAVQAFLAKQAA